MDAYDCAAQVLTASATAHHWGPGAARLEDGRAYRLTGSSRLAATGRRRTCKQTRPREARGAATAPSPARLPLRAPRRGALEYSRAGGLRGWARLRQPTGTGHGTASRAGRQHSGDRPASSGVHAVNSGTRLAMWVGRPAQRAALGQPWRRKLRRRPSPPGANPL